MEQGGQAFAREGRALGDIQVGAQLGPFGAAGQAGRGLERRFGRDRQRRRLGHGFLGQADFVRGIGFQQRPQRQLAQFGGRRLWGHGGIVGDTPGGLLTIGYPGSPGLALAPDRVPPE